MFFSNQKLNKPLNMRLLARKPSKSSNIWRVYRSSYKFVCACVCVCVCACVCGYACVWYMMYDVCVCGCYLIKIDIIILQIHYTRIDGMKCLRVISASQPITFDRNVAEKSVRVDLLAAHNAQMGASYAHKGMYDVWCMMYDVYVWCMMYDVWCMMYVCVCMFVCCVCLRRELQTCQENEYCVWQTAATVSSHECLPCIFLHYSLYLITVTMQKESLFWYSYDISLTTYTHTYTHTHTHAHAHTHTHTYIYIRSAAKAPEQRAMFNQWAAEAQVFDDVCADNDLRVQSVLSKRKRRRAPPARGKGPKSDKRAAQGAPMAPMAPMASPMAPRISARVCVCIYIYMCVCVCVCLCVHVLMVSFFAFCFNVLWLIDVLLWGDTHMQTHTQSNRSCNPLHNTVAMIWRITIFITTKRNPPKPSELKVNQKKPSKNRKSKGLTNPILPPLHARPSK